MLIQAPDAANPNRLVYRTAPLSRDVRMSGTPWVTLRMSVDNRTAANLTAVLVDYGPGATEMVTRGWLDPQNRNSLTRSDPVEPGRALHDALGPAARRPRVRGRPSDRARGGLDRPRLHDPPEAGDAAHAGPNASEISLPVVGGAGALR